MLGLRSIATYGIGLIAGVGLSGAAVVFAIGQTDLVPTLSPSSALPLLLIGLIGVAGVLMIGQRSTSARNGRAV